MIVDIWEACEGDKKITTLNETAWRIVGSPENLSTRKLVDSIEEQKILEELIDQSKSRPLTSQNGFHPLLVMPFRDPPLENGSRFGKKTEASLWYGSKTKETAMAEKAYYQLAFINASNANLGTIISFMTIFSVKLKIKKAIELNKAPFLAYKEQISSPTNYDVSQTLGKTMREKDIDGFTYNSARDNHGVNIGLYKMKAFANHRPDVGSHQTWQCYTTKKSVEFMQMGPIDTEARTFSVENFMINGKFPMPAIK